MSPGNPKYRYLYAVWGFLECFLFGGLIYGWGSLVFILKDEGIYLDLCEDQDDNETTATDGFLVHLNASKNTSYSMAKLEVSSSLMTCDERDSKLALVFTIGSSVLCAGCYVIGQVNFKFGTRVTRLAATTFFIPGALLIAFTSKEVPWLIFPGLICLALGGVTCFITNNQIALLFPTGGLALVGFLCGGYDASATVLLLIKIAYENGITRQTSFICLAVLYVFTLVNTLWFLPKDFIKMPQTDFDQRIDTSDQKEITCELINDTTDKNIKHHNRVPPLKSSMLSRFFILHIFWISVLQLRFYFFLNSINTVLEHLYTTNEEVSQSTNVFMYVLMCGCFAAPLVGFVYVSQKRLFSNDKFPFSNALMPSVIPLAATTILCLLFSGLMMLEDPDMLYLVYILVLFFRAFLYTMAAGFLSAFFPTEHFAILYGFQLLIGAIISVFQYALFSWAEASGFHQVNIFLLILMFTTFIHPLYIWKSCRTEKHTKDEKQLKFTEILNASKI